MKIAHTMIFALASLGLTACGSSDDSNGEFPQSAVQFFNASANSASTRLLIDESSIGSSVFGDATTLVNLDEGTYEVTLRWTDSEGQDQDITTEERFLPEGAKTLIVMTGDFNSPDIVNIEFDRSDLDEGFTLRAFSAVPNETYDLYIGNAGAPFSEANLIDDLSFNEAQQLTYFDADDDPLIWESQEYKVFLTQPGGTEVIYESDNIDFDLLTDYVMIIRPTTGPGETNLAVDIVVNSTAVESFSDLLASAQFRVYNSLNLASDILVNIMDSNGLAAQNQLSSDSISDFSPLPFGDYQVNVIQESDQTSLLSNGILTLNQDQARTLVVYQDENDEVRTLNFSESNLPQTFEHDFNVVNLVPEFDDLILYFVRAEETLETAEFQVSNLDFASVRSETLPSDFYQFILIAEDENQNEQLLYISDLIGIDEELNYLVTIERDPEDDSTIQVNIIN
ncbi:DUF4397 domain-containing protein [Alteromonadaceae bacterium M269]|nr:DUF4397 domain-containing protein [Alteromonadaceae bacterium M269]